MKKATTAAQIAAGLTPTFPAYCRYFAASQGIAHSRLDREMARRDYDAAYAAPAFRATDPVLITEPALGLFAAPGRVLNVARRDEQGLTYYVRLASPGPAGRKERTGRDLEVRQHALRALETFAAKVVPARV